MTIPPQLRVYSVFFFFALMAGAMMSRLPDLQDKLGVTQGQLGLTLIGMSIGSMISLTFSTPLIERLGPRLTALITSAGTSLCYALVPFMPDAPAVFVLLFVCGLLGGALEINLNVETDRLEAMTGRRFMNRAHGSWSLGFFLTALAGAGIRQSGLTIEMHLALAGTISIVVATLLLWGLVAAPPRKSGHQGKVPRIAFPTIALLPLCLIGIAAFLIEGSGVDWSAIYMRDAFHAEPFIGGLGLTLFGFLMAAVRLGIDPVVHRFGPRNVAVTLLSVAAIGALIIGFTPYDWLAVAGFGLLGIGCSAVYPLALSAAAQRTDRPAAVNVAAVSQVTFVIFFLAPPLLGVIAQYWGIRNSYLITLPVTLIGLVAAARALPMQFGQAPEMVDAEPATPHG